jgi:hypothetical protein
MIPSIGPDGKLRADRPCPFRKKPAKFLGYYASSVFGRLAKRFFTPKKATTPATVVRVRAGAVPAAPIVEIGGGRIGRQVRDRRADGLGTGARCFLFGLGYAGVVAELHALALATAKAREPAIQPRRPSPFLPTSPLQRRA